MHGIVDGGGNLVNVLFGSRLSAEDGEGNAGLAVGVTVAISVSGGRPPCSDRGEGKERGLEERLAALAADALLRGLALGGEALPLAAPLCVNLGHRLVGVAT